MMEGASVLAGGGTMLGPSRARSPLAGRGRKKKPALCLNGIVEKGRAELEWLVHSEAVRVKNGGKQRPVGSHMSSVRKQQFGE